MFRQKIAQVTNCSCRLINNDKSDFNIFRIPTQPSKSIVKDQKQKYSLKTQNISSGKNQKYISAKKTASKQPLISDDERISISGNISSKKKKIDRYQICSPQGFISRNFNDNLTPSGSLPKVQNNFSKGAYLFKTKNQNKLKLVRKDKTETQNYKTFGALKKQPTIDENSRQKFDNYVFLQKNKQNTIKAGNLRQDQRLIQRADKSLKKIKDIFQNELSLKERCYNINRSNLHGSLQKYQKGNRDIKISTNETYFDKQNFDFNFKKQLSHNQTGILKQHFSTNHPNLNNKQFNLSSHRSLFSCQNSTIQPSGLTYNNQNFFDSKISNISINDRNKNFITQRTFLKTQNSQSSQIDDIFNYIKSGSVQKNLSQKHEISRNITFIQNKVTHKKLSTFDDIIGRKEMCESILENEQNQNQNSIVIMTFKDLIEKAKNQKQQKQQYSANKSNFLKNSNAFDAQKASIITNQTQINNKFKTFVPYRQNFNTFNL